MKTDQQPGDGRDSRLQAELERAARVHYSFLPEHYEDERLRVATHVSPKSVLGGDYCSVIPLGERQLAACICDAAGHGLASALYAARINTFVLTNILQGHDPCELVSELNEFLCCRLTESGMYASFFVVLVDTGAMELRYAGAGHPAVLHLRAADGQVRWLEPQSTLLGIGHPLPVECSLEVRPIAPGDRILLYTDGLTEARDGCGEEFGRGGLERHVIASARQDNRDFVHGIPAAARAHCGGELQDDVLCLGIQVKPV